MAPRPKNPPENRRQDILSAALRVFARKGYAAATNAEIAGEAGVTAAALYYYFRSKEELFKAALAERIDTVAPLLAKIGDPVTSGPPEQVIPLFVRNLMDFLAEARTEAVLSIILAEGAHHPELVEAWQAQVINRAAGALVGYLDHQMQLGRLRRLDPRALLVIVVGPVIATVMSRDILKIPLLTGLTNDILAESLTATLLHGLPAEA